MPSFLSGNCSHVLNADKLAESSFCVSSCLVHPLPWRAGPLTVATFNVALTVVRIFEQLRGCDSLRDQRHLLYLISERLWCGQSTLFSYSRTDNIHRRFAW